MSAKLLKKNAVLEICALSHSTLYRWMSKGDFPLPLSLGERAVAWKEDEIMAWIESRPRTCLINTNIEGSLV